MHIEIRHSVQMYVPSCPNLDPLSYVYMQWENQSRIFYLLLRVSFRANEWFFVNDFLLKRLFFKRHYISECWSVQLAGKFAKSVSKQCYKSFLSLQLSELRPTWKVGLIWASTFMNWFDIERTTMIWQFRSSPSISIL